MQIIHKLEILATNYFDSQYLLDEEYIFIVRFNIRQDALFKHKNSLEKILKMSDNVEL